MCGWSGGPMKQVRPNLLKIGFDQVTDGIQKECLSLNLINYYPLALELGSCSLSNIDIGL